MRDMLCKQWSGAVAGLCTVPVVKIKEISVPIMAATIFQESSPTNLFILDAVR